MQVTILGRKTVQIKYYLHFNSALNQSNNVSIKARSLAAWNALLYVGLKAQRSFDTIASLVTNIVFLDNCLLLDNMSFL